MPNQDGAQVVSNVIVANSQIVLPKRSCWTIAIKPGIKQQIVERAINGSGIQDTARVLTINKNTVINTLKKREHHCSGQPHVYHFEHRAPDGSEVGAGL